MTFSVNNFWKLIYIISVFTKMNSFVKIITEQIVKTGGKNGHCFRQNKWQLLKKENKTVIFFKHFYLQPNCKSLRKEDSIYMLASRSTD